MFIRKSLKSNIKNIFNSLNRNNFKTVRFIHFDYLSVDMLITHDKLRNYLLENPRFDTLNKHYSYLRFMLSLDWLQLVLKLSISWFQVVKSFPSISNLCHRNIIVWIRHERVQHRSAGTIHRERANVLYPHLGLWTSISFPKNLV